MAEKMYGGVGMKERGRKGQENVETVRKGEKKI